MLQFRTLCSPDSIPPGGNICEDFENEIDESCFSIGNWKLGSDTVGNTIYTRSGRQFLYTSGPDTAEYQSNGLYFDSVHRINVSGLLFTGKSKIKHFEIDLIQNDNGFETNLILLKDSQINGHHVFATSNAIKQAGVYKLRIRAVANINAYILLDSLCISKTLQCLPPKHFAISSKGTYSFNTNWNLNNSAVNGYNIVLEELSETGAINRFNTFSRSDTSWLFKGIRPGVKYQTTVASRCADGEISSPSDTLKVLLDCPVLNSNELNRLGEILKNDSHWACWTFKNNGSSSQYNWRYDSSIVKSALKVKDAGIKGFGEYLSVYGVDQIQSSKESSVESPAVDIESNEMLMLKLSSSRYQPDIERPDSNNLMFVGIRDTGATVIDTLFKFNSDVNEEWADIAIELPGGNRTSHFVFGVVRNSIRPKAHDIAIDLIKLTDSTCIDLFSSPNQSGDENNMLCYTRTGDLYVGRGSQLSHISRQAGIRATSFGLFNRNDASNASRLSSMTSYNADENKVGSYWSLTRDSASDSRVTDMSRLDIQVPFIHFKRMIEVIASESADSVQVLPEEVRLLASDKILDVAQDSLAGIDSSQAWLLNPSSAVSDSTWKLDSSSLGYIISIKPDAFGRNFVMEYSWPLKKPVNGIQKILNGIELHPNPFRNQIVIHNMNGAMIRSVEVVDVQGKMVRVNNTKNVIDTRQLPPGAYTLKIYTDAGIIVRKMIKLAH